MQCVQLRNSDHVFKNCLMTKHLYECPGLLGCESRANRVPISVEKMAEIILITFAEGALDALIGKLAGLLFREQKLLSGLDLEVGFMKLKDEVDMLQSFLRCLSRSEDHNDVTKTWMKQVREMAYDAEDWIDQFLHQIRLDSKAKLRHKLATTLRFKPKLRDKLATTIERLNNRAEVLIWRRISYGVHIEENRDGISDNYIELGESFRTVDHAVNNILPGIDPCKTKLIELTERNWVVAIVGLGGLGKTTLAKEVYQDISAKYNRRAFVTVSQRTDLETLLLHLLKQLDKNYNIDQAEVVSIQQDTTGAFFSNQPGTNTEALPNQHDAIANAVSNQWETTSSAVYQKLNGSKYLLVLDDVWSPRAWESLRYLFPRQNGSHILITTRIEDVAHSCTDCSGIYRIEPLIQSFAQQLFWNTAGYMTDNSDSTGTSNINAINTLPAHMTAHLKVVPNHLKEVGNKIVSKCGGMPLAIIYIAKALASKAPNYDQWNKFFNSMGSQLHDHQSLHGLKQIVNLSFVHLPHYLKSCLLYLSIYPEDYEIRRKNLVRRWVAEGFVTSRRGMSAEEVSESYFEELVSRSIVQRAHVGYSGKIKTCRIHDIMLELIVSRSIEDNFITVLGEQFGVPPHNIRRLTAHDINENERPRVAGSLSQIRSFTAFGNVRKYMSSFTFELLRVLDLEGCKGLGKLNSICSLFLLRFLSLRATDISTLPRNVGKLTLLETLDIRQTKVAKLPNGIAKMNALVHLLAGSKRIGSDHEYRYLTTQVRLPRKFHRMDSIKTLSVVRMPEHQRDLNALVKLKKLYKFGICISKNNSGNNEALRTALLSLVMSLRSLNITGHDSGITITFLADMEIQSPLPLKSLELRGYLGALPGWIQQLRNVTEITLCYSKLNWIASMNVLKQLPSLLSLILQPLSIITETNDDGMEPALLTEEFFVPAGFKTLKTFVIDEGRFPSLKFLSRSMPNVEKIELSISWLPSFSGMENLESIKELFLQGPDNENFAEMVNIVTKAVKSNKNMPTITVVKYPE